MIAIKENKKLEYGVYLDFHDFSVAGVDFGAAILKNHTTITVSNHRAYIDHYYEKNKEAIDISVADINNLLTGTQDSYFKAIEKYFDADYSKKKYVGYISIFNCNPRFLEDNTFQVYYKKDALDKLEVCFHEVSHFVFFDYCTRQVKSAGQLDANTGPLWELSEIVNVIVLNQPEFRKVLGKEELLFYPELKEKSETVKRIWNACGGKITETFINEALEFLAKTV